jgi:NAD(P)H-quinone oxidoreductase subunit 5
MGLAQLLLRAALPRSGMAFLAGAGAVVALAVVYFALQAGAGALVAGALPAGGATFDAIGWAIAVLVVLGYGAVSALSMLRARPGAGALYVHLNNGLYLNALADRAMARLWPSLAAPGSRGA